MAGPRSLRGAARSATLDTLVGVRTLETERLILRPVEEADLAYFTDIHADPLVARYIGSGKPRTPQESRAWIERVMGWEREVGLSHLCLVARADGRRVGRCGLAPYDVELSNAANRVRPLRGFLGPSSAPADLSVAREIELGYTLERSAWGQGFATEAARAVRDFAFAELELERLMSLIHPDNAGSAGVARKVGLARFDTLVVDERGPYDRWLLYREEWERLPRGGGPAR